MPPPFKYAAHHCVLPECPPTACHPAGGRAFQLVHSPMTPRNFEPAASRSARRRDRCSSWALSMFTSHDNVVEHFRRLAAGPVPNVGHLLGDHVAEGTLQPTF